MSETQEIKDGLTVLEETEGREDATYDHIVKYTGFLGGIQVLTILVSVVRNKLAAVLLSTAGVGLSALYQSVIGFLHNTSNLGISFSSIKEIAEYYKCSVDIIRYKCIKEQPLSNGNYIRRVKI